jgi:hypothetical protein
MQLCVKQIHLVSLEHFAEQNLHSSDYYNHMANGALLESLPVTVYMCSWRSTLTY